MRGWRNLLPFAEMGCHTTGIDIDTGRIRDAKHFFKERQANGVFIASDIFMLEGMEHSFDLVICHDVIEHIEKKAAFLTKLHQRVTHHQENTNADRAF